MESMFLLKGKEGLDDINTFYSLMPHFMLFRALPYLLIIIISFPLPMAGTKSIKSKWECATFYFLKKEKEKSLLLQEIFTPMLSFQIQQFRNLSPGCIFI